MRFGLRWFASSCRRWRQFASRHWQWAWWRERRTARPKDGGLSRRSLVFAGKGGVDFSPRSVGRGAKVSVNLKWGARTMAVMMRGKGTSEVVSAPRGLEEGLRREEWRWGRRWWVVGSDFFFFFLLRSGKWLKCCNLDSVLVGTKKEVLWPLWTNLLEMWRNWVIWPKACRWRMREGEKEKGKII